jgi:hypothetical protein
MVFPGHDGRTDDPQNRARGVVDDEQLAGGGDAERADPPS